MTHNTTILVCPECKTYMTKAKNTIDKAEPKPGDYAICSNCAAILVFQINAGKMSYRIADEEDIAIAITQDIYTHILTTRDFILSGKHGYRNSTKQDFN